MRFLINMSFKRSLKDNYLGGEYIHGVLDDIFKGRATPLGSKLYKIRAAKKGKGKSGGLRNIFFWKRHELIVFCLLFGKNEQDNFTPDEKKVLKILSDEYDQLSEKDMKILIRRNKLEEIYYDQEE